MRYFVVFLMLLSLGMFAMGCGDDDTTKKPDKPAAGNGDDGNGNGNGDPVDPVDPVEPTP